MLNIVRRILKLAGPYKRRIQWSFFFSVLESIFINAPLLLVFYVLMKTFNNTITIRDVYIIGILLAASVVLRALSRYLIDVLESGTGYQIFTDERMKLGNNLKKMNMGYFSEDNLGDVSAVITSDIVFIEEFGMDTLSKVVSGYIGVGMTCIIILAIDLRIGLILTAFSAAALTLLHLAQNKLRLVSAEKQKTQSGLTSAVIEYVKGLPVIKAFYLSDEKAKATAKTFRDTRDVLLKLENIMTASGIQREICLALGSGLLILFSSFFAIRGTMPVYFVLMVVVFAFEFFASIRLLSGVATIVRVMEAGLDRYDKIRGIKGIDTDGKDLRLNRFDVSFENVTFAYEDDDVLHNLSFHAEERTMTALVGKSGCGKTTIASLIARFWDVQHGSVKIGGTDVRDMAYDSLLENISMVFQDVYLFNDTILNNIRFGKPDATMEEVIAAAKKARCHEFISGFEQGYETMVGESGSTLSGGEKQRISIARAILKDSPIVLFDEATASVDPDNEAYIQEAIDELVKNKTLIVIAHKLSTIKNADQILVMDKGEIIERGKHEDLIKDDGTYSNFWQRRMQAGSWKIAGGRV